MTHPHLLPFSPIMSPMGRQLQRAVSVGDYPNAHQNATHKSIEPTFSVENTCDSTQFVIELPGVEQEDINIKVKNRILIIRANRYRTNASQLRKADQPTHDSSNCTATQHSTRNLASNTTSRIYTDQTTQLPRATAPSTSHGTPTLVYKLSLKLDGCENGDAVSFDSYKNGVLILNVAHL